MKITKYGHCCLLIEIGGLRILTDPGIFSAGYDELQNIGIVLITHEHPDHLHIEGIKAVLAQNPTVEVITNSAVGKLLDDAGVTCTILDGAAKTERNGVSIDAYDGKHEEIYLAFGQVQNTGFLIGKRFFYPGDSFSKPGVPVEVLALPVSAPWCRIKDAIAYALEIKPHAAFPVHDGIIAPDALAIFHGSPKKVLEEHGIAFTALKSGESVEYA
jgi:L-ascorbate metabolism protein UlaG (beta-lactamase superfamily)